VTRRMATPKPTTPKSGVPKPDILKPGIPRYRAVAAALDQAIASGEHAVGTTLPPEKTLCETFGVSRHTIRDAIRLIERDGLVSRRQGSGTTVCDATPDARYVQSLDSLDEILQYAAATTLCVHDMREITVRDATECKLLGAAPGERWLRIEAMRLAGTRIDGTRKNQPIAWTTLYLPERFFALRDKIGTVSEAIYRLIEKRFGARIAEIDQEINATVIIDDMARRLCVDPGTPGLHITRRYLDVAGRPLEVAVNLHPAKRFAYRMQLRRTHA